MSKGTLKGLVIGLAVVAAVIFAFQLTSAHPPWAPGHGGPGYYGRGPGMGPGPGHGWHQGYGRMMYGPYGRFDPGAKKTVSGEVVRVERETPVPGGRWGGYHLVLKTASEGELEVELGPAFFIDRQNFELRPGDRVEVEGFAFTHGGAPAVIASKVKRGDAVLTLRDEAGFPLWAGFRREPGYFYRR